MNTRQWFLQVFLEEDSESISQLLIIEIRQLVTILPSMGSEKIWYVLYVILYVCSISTTEEKSPPPEREMVFSGSTYQDSVGQVLVPPPVAGSVTSGYAKDRNSYIFILENVAPEGAVQVTIHSFRLHPSSWMKVRDSKYGGYIGRIIGKYNSRKRPPDLMVSETCCMRLEFHTGCCGKAEPRYTGLNATYRFINYPGKGRRTQCYDPKYPQVCNGECISPLFECPCRRYGQFKCENQLCIDPNRVCNRENDCGDNSDEHRCTYGPVVTPWHGGTMYYLAVVLGTTCALVLVTWAILTTLWLVDTYRGRHLRDRLKMYVQYLSYKGPVQFAKIWPRPDMGYLHNPRGDPPIRARHCTPSCRRMISNDSTDWISIDSPSTVQEPIYEGLETLKLEELQYENVPHPRAEDVGEVTGMMSSELTSSGYFTASTEDQEGLQNGMPQSCSELSEETSVEGPLYYNLPFPHGNDSDISANISGRASKHNAE